MIWCVYVLLVLGTLECVLAGECMHLCTHDFESTVRKPSSQYLVNAWTPIVHIQITSEWYQCRGIGHLF